MIDTHLLPGAIIADDELIATLIYRDGRRLSSVADGARKEMAVLVIGFDLIFPPAASPFQMPPSASTLQAQPLSPIRPTW